MRTGLCTVAIAVVGLLSLAAQQASAPPTFRPPARSPSGRDISWAFGETNAVATPEAPTTVHRIAGSAKTYTRAQIDDLLNAVDWFPDAHPPAPAVVTKGHGEAQACGVCHLMSGHGHPQSADITGLPVEYFRRTMGEFRSGARVEPNHMNAIAGDLSEQEIRETADWYASLEPTRWTVVKEAAAVPNSWIPRGRMRLVSPAGGTEPLGHRIITLPQDPDAVLKRDPRASFVAYVPIGSIRKGEELVKTGGAGKTVACATCHGDALKGQRNVPRLAGVHPAYLVRQLYLFQDGRRNGDEARSMKKSVERLTDDDIIDISAYLGSLDPAN